LSVGWLIWFVLGLVSILVCGVVWCGLIGRSFGQSFGWWVG